MLAARTCLIRYDPGLDYIRHIFDFNYVGRTLLCSIPELPRSHPDTELHAQPDDEYEV